MKTTLFGLVAMAIVGKNHPYRVVGSSSSKSTYDLNSPNEIDSTLIIAGDLHEGGIRWSDKRSFIVNQEIEDVYKYFPNILKSKKVRERSIAFGKGKGRKYLEEGLDIA